MNDAVTRRLAGLALPARPGPAGGVLAGYRRLSLARQFLLASLVVVVAGTVITGAWVGEQIESGVLSRTAAITALYVDSIVTPHLQGLAHEPRLDPADMAALDGLVTDTPLGQRVVAFKVWSPDGEVLYSPNRSLVGRRFERDAGLVHALAGEVTADISTLQEPENEYERQRWSRLVEVYAPVRQTAGGPIIGVTEFYQLPDELEAEIAGARLRSWAVVAGIGLATYLLLAGIVRGGSDTIARQQQALHRQLAELGRMLDQNRRLHERVRQAAGRTTALNERALRRISADLHDGPGQALALALLRLDALRAPHDSPTGQPSPDFAVVQAAVRDALAEVRAISAGLRLPELAPLSVAQVAERAVRDHERRSGTPVRLTTEAVPDAAPLAVKIALLRTLQEALSNATRHGGGAGVTVRLWSDGDLLCVAVSDRGPGFRFEAVDATRGLGLAGMRERAELLGGSFAVRAAPGRGATVRACWPLGQPPADA
jgi:signal transduction histidine kinase